LQVVLSELFRREDRTPLPNGPLDAKMVHLLSLHL